MKKLLHFLALIVIAITINSCTKTPEKYKVSGDYFIMGRIGGFTIPDAKTTYYLVNNGELRKDMTQRRQSSIESVDDFNFHYLFHPADYVGVNDIPYSIPDTLLKSNNQTIGEMIPDAGNIDMRASINGVMYKWTIEYNIDSVDVAIRDFVNRCETAFNR
jgi:hypothetical protein